MGRFKSGNTTVTESQRVPLSQTAHDEIRGGGIEMKHELLDLYKLANETKDKDAIRAFQQARDRISPQIAVDLILENDRLRAELAEVTRPYPWRNEPPTQEGEFFYNGKTPDWSENILAIVHVVRDAESNELTACLFIPPYWRGDKSRTQAKLHYGTLDKWEGRWAGPEFGLCTVEE
jgi:hypothetical protein